MANGEQGHKLNFPDNDTEPLPVEKKSSSQYIGVRKESNRPKWESQRYSKLQKKMIYYGSYEGEEIAARASDTLARKLMANGEQSHKLNFPDDHAEVYAEERTTSSKFIGVSYHKNISKWRAQRYSKAENKQLYNGCYDNEDTAAHAS